MKLSYHELCEKLFIALKKWNEVEQSIIGQGLNVWHEKSKIFTQEWDDIMSAAQWTDQEFFNQDNKEKYLNHLIIHTRAPAEE